MDGAEHSGMLENVMAAVHVADQNQPQVLGQDEAQNAVMDAHRDRFQNVPLIAAQGAVAGGGRHLPKQHATRTNSDTQAVV